MTIKKQQERFQNEIHSLIQRYIDEYDLTLGQIVGVIEVEKHELIMSTIEVEAEIEITDPEEEDEQ